MAVEGSDCPGGGKRQYATKQAAANAAGGMRSRGRYIYPFKCAWCMTWHIGNRRAFNSKGRTRNTRS